MKGLEGIRGENRLSLVLGIPFSVRPFTSRVEEKVFRSLWTTVHHHYGLLVSCWIVLDDVSEKYSNLRYYVSVSELFHEPRVNYELLTVNNIKKNIKTNVFTTERWSGSCE